MDGLLQEHSMQLRDLRETQSDLVRDVSATGAKLEELSADVSRGFDAVSEKVGKIADGIQTAFHDEHNGIYSRLRTVETTHSQWGARLKWAAGIVTSVLTAVVIAVVVAMVKR